MLNTPTDRRKLDEMGYHACKYNVLYEMEYCDPGGLNLAVPPKNLHTVLLGLYVRQLRLLCVY